jgi:hypothetical protein
MKTDRIRWSLDAISLFIVILLVNACVGIPSTCSKSKKEIVVLIFKFPITIFFIHKTAATNAIRFYRKIGQNINSIIQLFISYVYFIYSFIYVL